MKKTCKISQTRYALAASFQHLLKVELCQKNTKDFLVQFISLRTTFGAETDARDISF